MDKIDIPIFTSLKKIENEKGDIFHVLKKSDSNYISFGEAYFSTINFGIIKGWKKHKKMQCNLIVPSGKVRFRVISLDQRYFSFILSKENYGRLMIPPGCWFSFEGLSEDTNLILNIASIEHDPEENENLPLNSFQLEFFD
jgi:dTDP-4-dehydrorhamnose 3,5-epimerase